MGFFLQAGFVGTGVDISQPMLDIAHSCCPAATFVQGDMCELPWQDHHTMVALGIEQLTALLAPYFAVTLFEHNHQAITPWQGTTGNVIVVAVKR